jgi:hypothetical protein
MNVLLVAPHSDLPQADAEVQAVVNALRPTVLLGTISLIDLQRELARPHDLIWFACHGDPDGLQIGADWLLDAPTLVQLLRAHPPSGVFINSCQSLSLAQDIHHELGVPVIATVISVADLDAYVTGTALATALAAGVDLHHAYQSSRPGAGKHRNYIMLNNRVEMNADNRMDDLAKLMLQIGADLRQQIETVERRMSERIDDIETRVGHRLDAIDNRLPLLARRPGHRRSLQWAAGFSLFVLVIALAYVQVRQALDLSPAAALLISILLLAGSFALFASGLGLQFAPRASGAEE